MNENIELPLHTPSELANCQIQLISSTKTDDLTLQMLEPYALSVTAQTWFEALCLLREQLESKGVFLLCYGAALNFYPSPMSLSMGEGRSVYELHLGQAARMNDLRDIFETQEDLQPCTLVEQRRFYIRWLESLKGRFDN